MKINVKPEFHNFFKKMSCLTADYERGFILMNNICIKLRSRLTIQHMASLMFISLNGPPLDQWKPEMYVKSLLVKY